MDPDDKRPLLFDSGYTGDELDAIWSELARGARFDWEGEALGAMMCVGLSNGDLIAESEQGTVMLPLRRDQIEANVAAVRAALAAGKTLDEALAVLPE